MLKKLSLSIVLLSGLAIAQTDLPLIPFPQEITQNNGSFILDKNTQIVSTKSFEADYLQQQLIAQFGIHIPISSKNLKKYKPIHLVIDKNLAEEEYRFTSTEKGITIKGRSGKEIFYGIQTLLQLIPVQSKNTAEIALVDIKDQPKFAWRGMHLDVSRHFFPLDFIKRYIDFLAMYKMNTFHWHLTDDQGWRLEIKKYPKLTSVGAWRERSMIGHFSDNKFEEKHYGGFYTQEEAREIVKYAAERHITVIPEIEMPGHSTAAIASYPEFGCTGKPIDVAVSWGVLEDIYCPSEETFTFLENVLLEVMDIFPSKTIHIGGDEVPKIQWKNSPLAQAVIKRENLKDEEHLQSYFIQRIEKFLNKHGREIVGWDEILEGGLAPNAKVMSWRGFEGGIIAAKQKHSVIMAPEDYTYLNRYQGNAKNEPLSFGGFVPIEKVYSFNPIPQNLEPEYHQYILGAQGNLWAEYIKTPEHMEYMVFPRITAMAEAVWGTNKNYKAYENRLFQHFKVLDKKGIIYSKAIYEVKTEPSISDDKKNPILALSSTKKEGEIRYTTDGSEPTITSAKYTSPIKVSTGNPTIKAAYFENGEKKSNTSTQEFFTSKAFGKNITLNIQPEKKYFEKGAISLVDGIKGNPSNHLNDWLGFSSGKDVEAIIDFEEKQTFSNLKINAIDSNVRWIYLPNSIEIAVSNDGKNFTSIKKISQEEIKKAKGIVDLSFPKQNARFVKIFLKSHGIIEKGMPGEGYGAWLFIDEISID